MDKEDMIWLLLRLSMGWTFFWAFIDKLFGLGFATKVQDAWINGGSPTYGFLKNAAKGPFASFYHSIAGTPVVNWLFMLGLFFVGLSLLLGVGVRIASYSGALMLLLMYSAVVPPANNPFLDEHIIFIIVLMGIAIVKPCSLWWKRTSLVRKYPILQ